MWTLHLLFHSFSPVIDLDKCTTQSACSTFNWKWISYQILFVSKELRNEAMQLLNTALFCNIHHTKVGVILAPKAQKLAYFTERSICPSVYATGFVQLSVDDLLLCKLKFRVMVRYVGSMLQTKQIHILTVLYCDHLQRM